LLGLQSGALVLVVTIAIGLAVERFLELTHPLADRAPHLGELLRAEDDERDGENDHELERAYVRHGSRVSGPTTRRWSPDSRSPRPAGCRCRWRGTSSRRRTR